MDQTWKIKSVDNLKADKLSNNLRVDSIISRLLVSRNVFTYSQAEKFFRPKITDLHNPYLMKGMESAVSRIELALKKKEKILIYGDYDVDGTTAVSLVYGFLRQFHDQITFRSNCALDVL